MNLKLFELSYHNILMYVLFLHIPEWLWLSLIPQGNQENPGLFNGLKSNHAKKYLMNQIAHTSPYHENGLVTVSIMV